MGIMCAHLCLYVHVSVCAGVSVYVILQTALCLWNEVQTPARELSCPVPLSLVSFVTHAPGMGTSLGAPPLTVSSVAIDVLIDEVTRRRHVPSS